MLCRNISEVSIKNINEYYLIGNSRFIHIFLTLAADNHDTSTVQTDNLHSLNVAFDSFILSGFLFGIAEYSQLFLGKYKGEAYEGELMDNDYTLDTRFVEDFSYILDDNWATIGKAELWLRRWLGL